MADPVTAFAHRADHVVQDAFPNMLLDLGGHDCVKSLVHRRPGQVVHGGVDDAKILLLAGFDVEHFCQAKAGVTYQ